MKTMSRRELANRSGAVAALCIALSMSGCGIDKQKIPDLGGPSELSISLRMTANPDVLTADGFSTSLVQVQVFDQNGQTVAGRTVLLALATTTGAFVDLGSLYSPTGSLLRAAEATVVTGANGVATAIYTAPPRTDFTANAAVRVDARLVGTDFNGATYNFVAIELKSAEPKLFPPGTGSGPTCSFVVEAPQGSTTCSSATSCAVKPNTSVLFQDTSFDSDGYIVRYDWYFGDGTGNEDSPDTNHVFRATGTFIVTHRVTDNTGLASACTTNITVAP
jgi:PKD domain